MNRFNVILYKGAFTNKKRDMNIIDNTNIAAEDYNSKEIFEAAKELVAMNGLHFEPYFRCTMTHDGFYIDFGSWSNFIYIEKQ